MITTNPDYCEAVWVKNEWSRYLQFMQEDKEKTLIPVYSGMTAYELPDEFQSLQAQDLSKIGAKQDLLRGVWKLVNPEGKKPAKDASAVIVSTMLNRAFESIQEKDWAKAEQYLNNVLDYEADNIEACFGKLLAGRHCSSTQELMTLKESLETDKNYQTFCKIGDAERIAELKSCEEKIQQNIHAEKNRKRKIKKAAVITIGILLAGIGFYKGVTDIYIPNSNYKKAVILFEDKQYIEALDYFENHMSYKDNANYVYRCYFELAMEEQNNKRYDSAIEIFSDLDSSEAEEQIQECYYQMAQDYLAEENWEEAKKTLKMISGYKDADTLYEETVAAIEYGNKADYYKAGIDYLNDGYYSLAASNLERAGDYEDAKEQCLEAKYLYCVENQNDPTPSAKKYIAELAEIEYKDAASILHIIESWHANIRVFLCEVSDDYQYDRISVRLSGGPQEDSQTGVHFVVEVNNQTFTYDSSPYYKSGQEISFDINNTGSQIDLAYDEVTIKAYDENDNLIGEFQGLPERE